MYSRGFSPQQREVSWPVNENGTENFKQEIELVYHLRMHQLRLARQRVPDTVEHIKLVVS